MPNETVKALDNIPLTLKFKFSKPKVFENDGKYGKFRSYSYGVVHQGVDKYFSATEVLNNLLSQLGDLEGRTLTLTLLQNPNDLKKKYWRIQDDRENDITPSFMPGFTPQTTSDTPSPQTRPTGAKMEATEPLNIPKLKEWANSTTKLAKETAERVDALEAIKAKERLNALESRLRDIESKLFPETGELSRDGVHDTEKDLSEIPY